MTQTPALYTYWALAYLCVLGMIWRDWGTPQIGMGLMVLGAGTFLPIMLGKEDEDADYAE